MARTKRERTVRRRGTRVVKMRAKGGGAGGGEGEEGEGDFCDRGSRIGVIDDEGGVEADISAMRSCCEDDVCGMGGVDVYVDAEVEDPATDDRAVVSCASRVLYASSCVPLMPIQSTL